MPSLLISGGPLLSLLCSARVCHCHCLLGCGELVCESFFKADDLPPTCHSSPRLTTFAFRPSEVRHPLLNLEPYGNTDALGLFPAFLKRTADVPTPSLSVMFGLLVRLGRFQASWRRANVTSIPKDLPSSSVANYRQI